MSSSKSISQATLWTVLDFIIGQGLSFVIIVVLARLLSPEEFGTVALLAIFLGLSNVIVESGFGQALIQNQDINDKDTSTVFWFSIIVAGVITSILILISPLISDFFQIPILTLLMNIMAVGVFLGSFGIVQRALFTKNMAFRQLTVVRLTSTTASGLLAIILANAGYGVYALAWQSCLAALITSIMLWFMSSWRPRAIFSIQSARKLFGFGGYMLASAFLEVFYSRAYTLLIGKFHGTIELGYFARAESTSTLISSLVTYPISRVWFPAFSRMKGNKTQISESIRMILRVSMLINTSAMLGLAAIAEPFIKTLYGSQWTPAVFTLQILCIGGLLMPLHFLNLQALMAIGRSDVFFRFEILKKFFGVLILIITSSIAGPIGVAWGILISGILSFLINTWYSERLLGYGAINQILDSCPYLLIAIVVSLSSLTSIKLLEDKSDIVHLTIGILTGISVFLIIIVTAKIIGISAIKNLPIWRD